VVILAGIALLETEDEESFDWIGETDLNWDSQETIRGSGDRVLLTCDEGHEWLAQVIGEPFSGDIWLQKYIARLTTEPPAPIPSQTPS